MSLFSILSGVLHGMAQHGVAEPLEAEDSGASLSLVMDDAGATGHAYLVLEHPDGQVDAVGFYPTEIPDTGLVSGAWQNDLDRWHTAVQDPGIDEIRAEVTLTQEQYQRAQDEIYDRAATPDAYQLFGSNCLDQAEAVHDAVLGPNAGDFVDHFSREELYSVGPVGLYAERLYSDPAPEPTVDSGTGSWFSFGAGSDGGDAGGSTTSGSTSSWFSFGGGSDDGGSGSAAPSTPTWGSDGNGSGSSSD